MMQFSLVHRVVIISALQKTFKKSANFFWEMLAGMKKVTTFASAIEKKTS
jgi:hypothetical protein